MRLFCESGSTANRDEEVLHLPPIVDAAESSPNAAAACAAQIRAFLQKPYYDKPHLQYNAIMLVRILSENPGTSFTKNFEDKFVKSTKSLLREGRDGSVQQILRETLDALEANRPMDPGVQNLVAMWRREKGKHATLPQPPQRMSRARSDRSETVALGHGQEYTGQLPPASELSSRIEEARNSAKILIQFLQTTPSEDILHNDLIKEFAERCQAASRSMQTYINCDNPVPDHDTLQTLIETNEQLSLANSRHQRAVLAARRALGADPSPGPDTRSTNNVSPPPQPPREAFAPPSSRPQENGAGMFGSTFGGAGSPTANGTTYGNYAAPSIVATAPVSPLNSTTRTSAHKPNVSVDSRFSTPRADDYDDLYDSPAVSRAPAASNPFADPTEPVQGNTMSASSPVSSAQPNTSPTIGRPGPGPWHHSTITDSFLGRQSSAADGITMHAPGMTGRVELDNHSKVGRM